jgi:hypothetical protein
MIEEHEMALRYAVSKKQNISIPQGTTTTASTYPVTEYKAFRKFATREQARAFKRLKAFMDLPLSIIDTQRQMVVR